LLNTVIYDISKYYFIHKSNYVVRVAFAFNRNCAFYENKILPTFFRETLYDDLIFFVTQNLIGSDDFSEFVFLNRSCML
jgi:hypothetical protein